MKNNRDATHYHKRAGAVVVLESTAHLAKVLIRASGDQFWVKLIDLTELVGGVIEESKSENKRSRKDRPNALPNTRNRVLRAA